MRALGLDWGEARIGVAISDELGMLAHPLETIVLKEVKNPIARVVELAQKAKAGTVILGLPRNMDGSYGPSAEKVRAFAEKLRTQFAGEVKLWDERLTSVAAQRALHDVGKNTKKGREVIDQVAAQMILQGWMDAQAMLGEGS